MDKIAAGPASDRRDLFQESASRLGMNPAIVEKDFWVCWILKLLFAEPALKNQMVFKGGTSLSKVFGLIDRFSEDIDLVLDWRLLGYHQEGAQVTQSKTQQSRHNQEMNAKAVAYIRDTLLSQLNHLFAPIPGIIARIDEDDPHTVNVFYPAAFEAAYIRPAVRLGLAHLRHGFLLVPTASRRTPLRPFRKPSQILSLRSSRLMPSGHFGKRQRSFIRKPIAPAQSRRGTRGITTTSTS
jgi:hypothetical protein